MQRAFRILAQLVLLSAGWYIGQRLGAYVLWSAEFYPHPSASQAELLRAGFLSFGIGPLIGVLLLFASPVLRPRLAPLSSRRTPLIGLAIVVLLYGVTYAIGAPLVRRNLAYMTAGGETRPWQQTRLVVPVLPGVLLAYHEYVLAPLAGAGGWYFFLWHGTGVVPLGQQLTWISYRREPPNNALQRTRFARR